MNAVPTWVTLVVCGLTAALVVSCSGSEQPAGQSTGASSSASSVSTPVLPPPPAPLSDEDQVRDTLLATADAYNTQNWDAYLELLCPEQRAKFTGQIMDSVKKTRAQNGLSYMKVQKVTIDGDTAKATVEASNEVLGTQTLTMPLERSDGWKLCVKDGVT